jgi:hypothetical protein
VEVIQQNGVDSWTGIFRVHTAGINTQAYPIPLRMITGLNESTSVHAGCPKTELAIWGPQPRLPPFQHKYSWDTSALVIGLDSHIVEWVEPDCGDQHFMSFRAEERCANIAHSCGSDLRLPRKNWPRKSARQSKESDLVEK